jgi:hypothetical protein
MSQLTHCLILPTPSRESRKSVEHAQELPGCRGVRIMRSTFGSPTPPPGAPAVEPVESGSTFPRESVIRRPMSPVPSCLPRVGFGENGRSQPEVQLARASALLLRACACPPRVAARSRRTGRPASQAYLRLLGCPIRERIGLDVEWVACMARDLLEATPRPKSARSICSIRSTFSTGFFADVRMPRSRHLGSHSVKMPMT